MQKYIGSFENFQGHECYKISDTKDMEAFFINVVSSSDIWIFTSSKGGLTAGRKNADGAIFPYETDDKLHSSFATGKKVIIKVGGNFWEPFEKSIIPKYKIIQNIYKSIYGCKVTFEEINDDLKIAFSYTLESSEKFGFIVTSRIENLSEKDVEIEVVDGLQNIIPYGVNSTLQATSSTLVDAYKSAESLEKKLGIFSLTTVINDTPEPVEMLKANIAWTTKKDAIIHFDERVFSDFYSGNICNEEANLYGKKCGFFISFKEKITAKNAISYSFALDSEYDIIKIKELLKFIKTSDFSALSDDIENGIFDIKKSVELADGVQKSDDKIAISHHFLNTLYNIMRGGIFENEYTFNYDNFIEFAKIRNVNVTKYETVLDKIKGAKDINEMKKIASQSKVLHRLAYEYMPLSFSRRHGDPSRPWNRFNINLKNEKGEKIYFYEGNWRDIFQNWEALGMSFPFYFENIIAKFVNASTINGYNPYRINFYEIDWEKPEPNNPFSGFGYWGDHQIIYLLRLLKAMKNHFPTGFKNFLRLDIFSYANVPYIIKDFKEILRDSKNTIIFDYERDKNIEKLCDKMGTDGKLLLKNNEVYTVTLAEKLFVPLLSKMSNLMLGGGIFMNTQRPEWNDANNAIVGIGLSMVTVYHINSYIDFLLENISDESDDFLFSTEVVEWINSITYKT